MKNITWLICIFLISSFNLHSSEEKKRKIDFGIYVEDVYNIDYENSSYDIVFWIWVNADSTYFNLEENLDIIKSTEIEFLSKKSMILKNGIRHTEAKIHAKILNKYEVNNFPFDVQNLCFNIEMIEFKSDKCDLVFDQKNSKLTPEYIEKWKNIHTKYSISSNQYHSNFGNSDLGNSPSYEGIQVDYQLQRNKWSLFTKLFLTLFISFFLSSLSVFLPNKLSEEKIGLMLASLFTSIGNKYITSDSLPIHDSLNLSDKLHIMTIIFIAIFAIYAIFEQRKGLKDNLKLDTIIFLTSTMIYFTFVIIFCN
jgi:hypothetical protein